MAVKYQRRRGGGSYENPQLIINQQFDSYINRAPDVAQEMDQMVASIVAKNKMERAEQERLFAEQSKEQLARFDKVAGIKETGYGTFDQNMNNFFDAQTEKYFKIKQGIKDGTVSQMEGNRALSYLNNQVTQFRDAVVPIMAQTKRLAEALKIPPGQPGAISSRVPTAQQEVLLELQQGGNVNLVDNNGELVLFRPAGNGKEAAMVNVNELLQLENSGIEYFQTVPDLSESLKTVYDNTVKPGGKDNADLVTFNTKIVGDQEVTTKSMTPDQRQKAAQSMVKSNQFKGILDDEERMKSVWADMMNKDTDWMVFPPNATAGQIKAETQKQRDEASLFLANKALEDNAAADGIETIIGRRKYQPPTSQTSSTKKENVLRLETKEQIATYGDDYQAMTIEADQYVGKPQEIINRYEFYSGGLKDYKTKAQILAEDEDFKDADLLKDDRIYYIVDEEGNINPNVYKETSTPEDVVEIFAIGKGLNDAAIEQLKKKHPTKQKQQQDNTEPAKATKRKPY
tara:strand:- start:117 stop:1658 length:1542 start_codon:yes stop_codon:yes gene_type:complete